MSLITVVSCYYRYFNERRFDDAGQLMHPEATFHYVSTKQRLVGRAGYRALVAGWVIAFDDARIEITQMQQLVVGSRLELDAVEMQRRLTEGLASPVAEA
jgi:hypothetical protein